MKSHRGLHRHFHAVKKKSVLKSTKIQGGDYKNMDKMNMRDKLREIICHIGQGCPMKCEDRQIVHCASVDSKLSAIINLTNHCPICETNATKMKVLQRIARTAKKIYYAQGKL